MFRVVALQAEYGDSLWIEYGDIQKPRRILIDCGTKAVYKNVIKPRIEALNSSDRHFELFIVSHVDVDHIGGAIDFIRESKSLGVKFGDIWFNGYKQLQEASPFLGAPQGEELTWQLENMDTPCWNKWFRKNTTGSAVVVNNTGNLPQPVLDGNLKLTLLSPTPKQLLKLIPVWEKACQSAGIIPGAGKRPSERRRRKAPTMLGELPVDFLAESEFIGDRSPPNGTSISVMMEFEGKRAIFAADAFAPVLLSALARLEQPAPLELDAFKMAHHGSRKNTNINLVKAVKCKNWIISTNGKQFDHPDQEAIARVVKYGSKNQTLLFNYRTEFNDMWGSEMLREKYDFATIYPRNGVELDL
jgi:beta-lactamase superfamily II metal-dependent hydrolase